MCRCEFAKVPRNVFIGVTVSRSIGCDLLHLRNGVLTDSLVCRPMNLLAILRLRRGESTTAVWMMESATYTVLSGHLSDTDQY
jgi:hypothetical protein